MQQFVSTVALAYEALDTPFSLMCASLLEHKQWDDLVNLQVDPANYLDAEAYGRDVAAASLLRKCAGLPVSLDPRKAAVDAWLDAEWRCGTTNVKITRELATCQTTLPTLLDELRYRMSYLCGQKVPALQFAYNSGSTVSIPYSRRFLPNKVSPDVVRMTKSLWPMLPYLAEQGFIPPTAEILLHEGSVFGTVPKTSKTDRSIAKECDLNILVQGAIGRALRRRLNRFGLLLAEGQSEALHRSWARQASIDGYLATVDLSSASDTICYNLVRDVVPQEWFELMDMSRAPCIEFPSGGDKPSLFCHLEKFSTMGNGFTFELETALFSACAMVAMDRSGIIPVIGHNMSVYGDDIILPAAAVENLYMILDSLGFLVNARKSFADGPFRESCGGDFFNGIDVRPVFQSCVPSSPPEWFSFHNRLYTLSQKYPDSRWKRVLGMCLNALPTRLRRIGGPEHLGDVVLHGRPPVVTRRNWVDRIETLQPSYQVFSIDRWDSTSALQSALYLVGRNGIVPKRQFSLEIDRISISSPHVGSLPTVNTEVLGYKVQRIPAVI